MWQRLPGRVYDLVILFGQVVPDQIVKHSAPLKVLPKHLEWNEKQKFSRIVLDHPRVFRVASQFNYADNLTRMVLNPDVTVRVRGVMEKCSFCVQRIQEGKLTAKKEGRALRDGDIKSACQTACPTGAIVFGDTNDKDSEIAKRYKNELNYIVLEEVNTRPSVQYTTRVTNRDEALLS